MEETKETKKLSYEELENVARKLAENCKVLQTELEKATLNNIFQRLDYLFRVIENASTFDSEFVKECVTEIKEVMTLKEPEKKEE